MRFQPQWLVISSKVSVLEAIAYASAKSLSCVVPLVEVQKCPTSLCLFGR
ncbi:MAG: hypothetical protein V7K30_26210 [Nostoc sp.]